MEYSFYLEPKIVESKNAKQNRAKLMKNNFVETYLNIIFTRVSKIFQRFKNLF